MLLSRLLLKTLAEACGSRNHSESSNRPCLCGVADSHISPIITEYYCARTARIENSITLPEPHKRAALQPLLWAQSLKILQARLFSAKFPAQPCFARKPRIYRICPRILLLKPER